MITIVITSIVCALLCGVLTVLIVRRSLNSKYKNIIKEAEAEAEVIKKNKLLEVKEKFLNKKADLEKERDDDEFMAMYEQYEAFDDLEEQFMDMEEYITAKLAEYVDDNLGFFAEIV